MNTAQKYFRNAKELSDKNEVMKTILEDVDSNVVVYDIETTGLKPGVHGIVRMSFVDKNGKVLFDGMVKPDASREWDDEAQAANGISQEDVRYAPLLADVAGAVQTIIGSADVLVGYNSAGFGNRFLEAEGFDLPPLSYDVMLAFSKAGHRRWKPLSAARKHYGIESGKDGDSLSDAMATLGVLTGITKESTGA